TNEKFFDGTPLTKKVLNWKKQLILRADHIISISENTKNDIVSYYNIDPAKITTIYLAGGFDVIPKNKEMELVDTKHVKDYILFVGSRSKYKNFNDFATEIAPLLYKYDLDLLVAGGGKLNLDEINLLKSLNIYDRVVTYSHVSDSHLANLYKNAMVFIFPSLYEGFGIPVLEAMQCQCPVLLSNNSSLPEVGGSAAEYFDPFIKGDLKNVLEKLILNDDARTQMKIKGLQQALKFNWDITAVKHAEVYKLITA
ncbi:MAG: glycosyltransferase family 1 protein, partial [Mucilaginibacter sp.]|nr:glycosyltransferase family 1 protein [Mucilaginibacter sp.]